MIFSCGKFAAEFAETMQSYGQCIPYNESISLTSFFGFLWKFSRRRTVSVSRIRVGMELIARKTEGIPSLHSQMCVTGSGVNLLLMSFLPNVCGKTSVEELNELLNDQDLLKLAFATSMLCTRRLFAGGHSRGP